VNSGASERSVGPAPILAKFRVTAKSDLNHLI